MNLPTITLLYFVHEKNNHQSDTYPVKNDANGVLKVAWSDLNFHPIRFNTILTSLFI